MSDVSTNFPFLNEDPAGFTPGSFMGGATEDAFMAAVWRLRRWNFYGTLARVPMAGDPVTEMDNPLGPGYLLNGENTFPGTETSAFGDPDDILTNWRETRSYGSPSIGAAGIDIRWGPRGAYDPAGDPVNGGSLDSEILITATDGDVEYFLGTQEGRAVGGEGSGILDTAADIDFTFTDCDGNDFPIGLFFPAGGSTDDWTGTLILKPGGLWWPWVIDGDDTWDTGDGTELRDPRRNDTNGKPLIYSWQAP